MSEKTEQPTPKKLRDARKKGQVAHSKEVVSSSQIVVAFALIWIGLANFVDVFGQFILLPASYYQLTFEDAVSKLFDAVLETAAWMLLPFVLTLVGIGLAANFFQIGALLSFESVKPDLKKLNPISAIKKIFSLKNLVEFIKSIIKIFFLGALIAIVIKGGLAAMMLAPYCGLLCLEEVFGHLMKNIVLYTVFAFIVIAAADLAFQRYNHAKQLRMTKDEVKREYKEMEGDPIIKGRRRQLHRQLAQGGMEEKVRKSSVVVTNPTHIAVALLYDEERTPLPVVTAKGEDMLAHRIIEIAREAGVPVMRNVPLARALNETADIDQYIPSDLIEPVAEVLRLLRDLTGAQKP